MKRNNQTFLTPRFFPIYHLYHTVKGEYSYGDLPTVYKAFK